jgi:hypothetical protein
MTEIIFRRGIITIIAVALTLTVIFTLAAKAASAAEKIEKAQQERLALANQAFQAASDDLQDLDYWAINH